MVAFPLTLELSSAMRAFLLDRFQAGGAILDVMMDTDWDDRELDIICDEWEVAIDTMLDRLRDESQPVSVRKRAEAEILIDAFQGSTMPAKQRDALANGDITASQLRAYQYVAQQLQECLSAAFGRPVANPEE